MQSIWLDVTTLLQWNRPAVGVVRVESECAAYALLGEARSTRFCRFDASTGYTEVDRAEVQAALDRIRTSESENHKHKSSLVRESENVSLEQGAKRLVSKIVALLPSRIGTRVFNFAVQRRGAFHAGIRGLRELKTAVRELVRPASARNYVMARSCQHSEPKPSPFKCGDVYISLGLDWDQKDLAFLFAEKKRIGFKTLLFCYDVIPVKFPHLCVGDVAAKFAKYFADLAWCADQVLCISECSRRDLIGLLNELGAPVPKTGVIELGCDMPSRGSVDPSPEVAELLEHRFILFVSTIERRKNHETLYRAFTRLVDSGRRDLPLLVFVGMPGWGVNDFMADIHLDPRIKPFVRVLNRVSDGDLSRLYQAAYFTAYPSLYEGWGLPVAESLAAGKFCLASNAASIPEVGRDFAEYLDPWDAPAWAERIAFYSDHAEEVAFREQLIRTSFSPTKWVETASNIWESANALGADNDAVAQGLATTAVTVQSA